MASNPPLAAHANVKNPKINISHRNQLKLSVSTFNPLNLDLCDSEKIESSTPAAPPPVRDRDRSDKKQTPGEIHATLTTPYVHPPPPSDRSNRNTTKSPHDNQEICKRNLDTHQEEIFKLLTSGQQKRIRGKPNHQLEFDRVCNEIKQKDTQQLEKDLKSADMNKKNRATYLLIDMNSDAVKKNILSSFEDILMDPPVTVTTDSTPAPKGGNYDPFSDTPAVPNSPSRGRGKGGKGAKSQTKLQLDRANLVMIESPTDRRPLKATGSVNHFNASDFIPDTDPDSRYIHGQPRNDPYIKAAMLTLLNEPGRSEILKAVLNFLATVCGLHCEPPLRSAIVSKFNSTLPPWTIDFNLLESDRQSLTNAITTLQKYGNKIPCTFTDENDQPIDVDLRFNLSEVRNFDTADQVTYICRWPKNTQATPMSDRLNRQHRNVITYLLLQVSSKHFELLMRDINDRQDKRCSPPLCRDSTVEGTRTLQEELTDNWHTTRGSTAVMSVQSDMPIQVNNEILALTVKLDTLKKFRSSIKTALPPFAFIYHRMPDGSFEPIRCEINLAATDDLGPGLCLRTRTTHSEDNIYSPTILDFVPKHACPTCNAKSYVCNLCGDTLGQTKPDNVQRSKNQEDRKKFYKQKASPSLNKNLTIILTNQIYNPRTNMTATRNSSSRTISAYRSFLPPLFKPKHRMQRTSRATSSNYRDTMKLKGNNRKQEREQPKTTQDNQARQKQQYDWTKRPQASQGDNNSKKRPATQSLSAYMQNKKTVQGHTAPTRPTQSKESKD